VLRDGHPLEAFSRPLAYIMIAIHGQQHPIMFFLGSGAEKHPKREFLNPNLVASIF